MVNHAYSLDSFLRQNEPQKRTPSDNKNNKTEKSHKDFFSLRVCLGLLLSSHMCVLNHTQIGFVFFFCNKTFIIQYKLFDIINVQSFLITHHFCNRAWCCRCRLVLMFFCVVSYTICRAN